MISFSEHTSKEPPSSLEFGNGDKPYLFHYTRFQSALSILESQELWASNIHFLNDFREFREAGEIIASQCRILERRNPSLVEFSEKIRARIESVGDVHIHSFSFTENPDLLSQWRAYCEPNGIALGFDYSKLHTVIRENQFVIGKCIYDDRQKLKICKEIIQKLLDLLQIEKAPLEVVARYFVTEFIKWAPFFKHQSFAEENEWRAVSPLIPSNNENIAVRASPTMMTPYYRIKMSGLGKDEHGNSILPINTFVIGPHPNHSLISSGLNFALNSNRIQWHQVRYSKCPYRSV